MTTAAIGERAPAPSFTAVCDIPAGRGIPLNTDDARFAAPSPLSSRSASTGRSSSAWKVRAAAIDSTKATRAIPIAGPISDELPSRVGRVKGGKPDGTASMSAIPWSSSPNAAVAAIAPATTTMAAGTAGTQRFPASSAATHTARPRAWGGRRRAGAPAPTTAARRPVALDLHTEQVVDLSHQTEEPDAAEISSATKPSRHQPASSSTIPEKSASVDAAASGSGVPATATAVTAAMEELTLTLRARDVPDRAYAAIGTVAV